MDRKPLKIGVLRGEGPPPGYEWNVIIYDVAHREAMSFVSADQYQHLAMQFKDLALENDPSHSRVADVRIVEDFYELRDKGGILGKINVRVFFGLEQLHKNIVVLGCFKKETDGKTPAGIRIRMRSRWRNYPRRN